MGWNGGYEIIEQQVVGLYDIGVLNKQVLNVVMKPFSDRDIDNGGNNELKSKDGKSAGNIICFIIEPEKYRKVIENFIPDPDEPDYNEELSDLYSEITKREWQFW